MDVGWLFFRDTPSDPTVVLEDWMSVVAADLIIVRLPISSEHAVQKNKHVWSVVKAMNSCCVTQYIFSMCSGL